MQANAAARVQLEPGCADANPDANADAAWPDARAVDLAWLQLVQALAGGSGRQQTLSVLLSLHGPGLTAGQGGVAGTVAVLARQGVEVALASGDALAQHLAVALCDHLSDGGTCQRQLALARVRAEPANAAHWAALLSLGGEDSDQAWLGLRQAGHWSEGDGQRQALAAAALDKRLPPAVRNQVLQRVAQLPVPEQTQSLSALDLLCGHYGPSHPWGQACRHAAGLMWDNGSSADVMRRGLALGGDEGEPPSARRVAAQARLSALEAREAQASQLRRCSRAGVQPLPPA